MFIPGDVLGLLFLAIFWGLLHGLTPHGHSWLVLLPFAMGGMKTKTMLRVAAFFCLGMILTALAGGLILGWLIEHVPSTLHRYIEAAMGVLLVISGILFLARPLTIHHAIDHLCNEHCHTGEEAKLLHTGTYSAMFLLGVISMAIPCPTNIPMYIAITSGARGPVLGMVLFVTYALSTSIAIMFVAVAMTRARKLVEILEQRGYRLLIWRLSGAIVLAAGLYLVYLGLVDNDHAEHTARLFSAFGIG